MTQHRAYKTQTLLLLLHKGLIVLSIVGVVHAAWTGNLLALAWALLVFTMVLSSAIGWSSYYQLHAAAFAAMTASSVLIEEMDRKLNHEWGRQWNGNGNGNGGSDD